jgi:bifunctional NMN adenylyltransferase/nudix hydrolase
MKLFNNAMAIGRFHVLHNGHVGLINSMRGLAESSLVFIGSAQESGTERNPFPVSFRYKMLDRVLSSEGLTIKHLPDMTDETDVCFEWGRYLIAETVRATGKLPDLTVHGKEPSHAMWYSPADDEQMATLAIPRDMFCDVSSTDLRRAIVIGDYRTFTQMVPIQIHDMFDELQNELLKIPFYRAMLDDRDILRRPALMEAGK